LQRRQLMLADNRSSRIEADVNYRRLRAREVELRIAELEGRLIEITDMEEVIEDFAGMIRSELASLPARLTRDLVLRRTIEQVIDEILGRIADSIRQTIGRLETTSNSDGATATIRS
jgi:phage terminase Nu1 subunit (DNA packaging protein)